ncbi:MAG: oligoribonuclease [Myxococcales bacterium]|nr:oligoribonuclease [Myxococcales bacterium]MCB9700442.1 oligoribonuclease [Myxococcales bacterium]
MTAPTAPASGPPLVWIDLEMSGLDPQRHRILEIATIVTDGELNVLGEGPDLVIHEEEPVLAAMDAWCTRQHGESGLSAAVRASTLDLAAAEERTLEFLKTHCVAGESPLCGNSIGHDRRFILRHMPALAAFLHYRSVDVSSVKELCRRWYPAAFEGAPPKGERHRALDDIRESIAELRYYRATIFR